MSKQLVDFYSFNNKIYLVIKSVLYNNSEYVFLSNEMDASDDMIRRVSENKLLPIESDEEYLNVIKKMFN
ncbi:unknown [Mycoplasma sp. CAG:956]|nr:DUF1292 domain-containing protein [Bacilli bacterium]CCY88844.1 unknown [Mycoplasma sp. CAG:956]